MAEGRRDGKEIPLYRANVAPRDQEWLVKVKQGWNEPPKAENSPTTKRSLERTEKKSWDEGTCLESLLSNVGLKVPLEATRTVRARAHTTIPF